MNSFKRQVQMVKGVSILTEMYIHNNMMVCKDIKSIKTRLSAHSKLAATVPVILIVHRTINEKLHANLIYMQNDVIYYYEPISALYHYNQECISNVFADVKRINGNGGTQGGFNRRGNQPIGVVADPGLGIDGRNRL